MQSANPTHATSSVAVPALSLLQRSEAARQTMLVLLFGALTALSAQLQIPTQPVPITGQVFMVLLAGALLGPRLGFLSQITYLAFGIMGAPVFAGGKSTFLVLLGPTAGYLIGFPLAAWTAGLLAERCCSFPALAGSLLLASALILVVGGVWLGIGGTLVTWPGAPAQSSLASGVTYGVVSGIVRFLPLDAVKALAAAGVAWPLIRRAR